MTSRLEPHKKATVETDTSVRENVNKSFAKNDFVAFSMRQLEISNGMKVLDLCCGPGKQVAMLSDAGFKGELTGVDLSKKAIDKCKATFAKEEITYSFYNQSIDSVFQNELKGKRFDLIYCFYGLYYADDFRKVLEAASGSLSPKGRIVVVGPYGDNNKSMYEIIEKYYALDNFVKYTSTTFMNDVEECLASFEGSIVCDTMDNDIVYPSADHFKNYLLSTTFFDVSYKEEIFADIDKHFESNDSFVVTKKVKAIQLRR